MRDNSIVVGFAPLIHRLMAWLGRRFLEFIAWAVSKVNPKPSRNPVDSNAMIVVPWSKLRKTPVNPKRSKMGRRARASENSAHAPVASGIESPLRYGMGAFWTYR